LAKSSPSKTLIPGQSAQVPPQSTPFSSLFCIPSEQLTTEIGLISLSLDLLEEDVKIKRSNRYEKLDLNIIVYA
jgi:hypothetical protein